MRNFDVENERKRKRERERKRERGGELSNGKIAKQGVDKKED